MPLTTRKSSSESQQTHEHQTSDYQCKLVYATRQNHPDDPLELAFAVMDSETGSEKIIKVENVKPFELFEQTDEGQRWLNQQASSSVRPIRRTA